MKKKSLIARIIVLVVAAVMFIGIIFSAVQAIAAESNDVVIENVTSGQLRTEFDKARGSIDQNNVSSLVVKAGVVSENDLTLLQNLSSCKVIDLSGTTLDGTKINDYLLSGRNIISIKLPMNTKIIGNGAFSGCSSLTEIIIPDTVNEIGNRAFESCSSLKTITLPQNINKIDECAFRGCSSLKEVIIKNQNAPQLVGNEVFGKDVKITVPESSNGYDKWDNVKKSDATSSTTDETTISNSEKSDEDTTLTQTEEAKTVSSDKASDISSTVIVLTIICCVLGAVVIAFITKMIFNKIENKAKK